MFLLNEGSKEKMRLLIKYALAPPLFLCMVVNKRFWRYRWSTKIHTALILIAMRLFAKRRRNPDGRD